MREALSQILVLGGLLWVYGLILFGARRRKGGQAKGLFQRFTDPSDAPIASTALAVLAALELLPIRDFLSLAFFGAMSGVVLAVAFKLFKTPASIALSVLGLVAAVVKAYSFVTEPAASGLAALGRWGYMTAIILVFFLVAALFQRSRLLTKRGGLSLFAIVEIATFLAAPGGQDVIGLTGKPDWMAIALALALAIVMGFAASEFILGLVAIAIAWISWSMDLVMGGASSVVSAGAGMAVLIAIIVVGVFG